MTAEHPVVDGAARPRRRVLGRSATQRRRWAALADASPGLAVIEALRGLTTSRGPDADAKVAGQLDRLVRRDPRWRHLRSIPVGINSTEIDHLVVGPGGVFTVHGRYHPDSRVVLRGNALRIDGAAYAYVSNGRHEALRASRHLSAACGFGVAVTGLVVVVGTDEMIVREEPGDVRVLQERALASFLRRQPARLDAPTVAAVFDAARRPGTWDAHRA